MMIRPTTINTMRVTKTMLIVNYTCQAGHDKHAIHAVPRLNV
jgi:hypothetical protein